MRYKRIYVEITNVCNMQCSFCPPTKRKSEFISIDNFEHILNEVKPFTDYIYLHVKGEPLLHPQLKEILSLLKEKGFKVCITTNGVLLSQKLKILTEFDNIIQISLSLHGHSNNKEKAFEILESIVPFVSQNEKYIILRLWQNQKNSFSEFENSILKKIESLFSVDVNKQIAESSTTTLSGFKTRLKDKLFLNVESPFEWPNLENPLNSKMGFCRGMIDMFGILVDGTVIPCCLDNNGDINLGNIFSSPIKDILSSKRAKNIYYGFKKHEVTEELCLKCPFRLRFDKPNEKMY